MLGTCGRDIVIHIEKKMNGSACVDVGGQNNDETNANNKQKTS